MINEKTIGGFFFVPTKLGVHDVLTNTDVETEAIAIYEQAYDPIGNKYFELILKVPDTQPTYRIIKALISKESKSSEPKSSELYNCRQCGDVGFFLLSDGAFAYCACPMGSSKFGQMGFRENKK